MGSYLNKFMKIFAVLFKNISGSIQSINSLRLGNTNEFIENLKYNTKYTVLSKLRQHFLLT